MGEGVHPEVVWIFRVPGGDVPGDPFAEAKAAKDAQGAGQPFLAVLSFLGQAAENWRALMPDVFGGE